MVSLYGIEYLAELPKRIVTEYLDYTAKAEVHESFHFGKIVEWVGKIAEACPKFNEWIDVSKLIGEGFALYRILPSNVVIFLDDLERAVDTPKSINNLLGSINELVENNTLLATFADEDAFQGAVNSYGGEKSAFLTPDYEVGYGSGSGSGGGSGSGSETGDNNGGGGGSEGNDENPGEGLGF